MGRGCGRKRNWKARRGFFFSVFFCRLALRPSTVSSPGLPQTHDLESGRKNSISLLCGLQQRLWPKLWYTQNLTNLPLASASERDISPEKDDAPLSSLLYTPVSSFFFFDPHDEKGYLCVSVRELNGKRKKERKKLEMGRKEQPQEQWWTSSSGSIWLLSSCSYLSLNFLKKCFFFFHF